MRNKLLVAAVSATLAMTASVGAAEQKTGTIVALDNAAKTFICQWGGEDRSYKTTDKTVFRVGTKNGTWSDLKLGERVNILYRVVDKDRVADRVVIEKR
jgi:maltoporin